jgi:hypothetical protein
VHRPDGSSAVVQVPHEGPADRVTPARIADTVVVATPGVTTRSRMTEDEARAAALALLPHGDEPLTLASWSCTWHRLRVETSCSGSTRHG